MKKRPAPRPVKRYARIALITAAIVVALVLPIITYLLGVAEGYATAIEMLREAIKGLSRATGAIAL